MTSATVVIIKDGVVCVGKLRFNGFEADDYFRALVTKEGWAISLQGRTSQEIWATFYGNRFFWGRTGVQREDALDSLFLGGVVFADKKSSLMELIEKAGDIVLNSLRNNAPNDDFLVGYEDYIVGIDFDREVTYFSSQED